MKNNLNLIENFLVKKPYEKIESGFNSISYSQFSTYNSCPFRWKLDKIDGLKEREGSINTLFGEAIHLTLQN
jgi:ATP-dependent helicase/DNAse subunit B